MKYTNSPYSARSNKLQLHGLSILRLPALCRLFRAFPISLLGRAANFVTQSWGLFYFPHSTISIPLLQHQAISEEHQETESQGNHSVILHIGSQASTEHEYKTQSVSPRRCSPLGRHMDGQLYYKLIHATENKIYRSFHEGVRSPGGNSCEKIKAQYKISVEMHASGIFSIFPGLKL